jgi:hypothetical protein
MKVAGWLVSSLWLLSAACANTTRNADDGEASRGGSPPTVGDTADGTAGSESIAAGGTRAGAGGMVGGHAGMGPAGAASMTTGGSENEGSSCPYDVTVPAQLRRRPLDFILVVDNSPGMQLWIEELSKQLATLTQALDEQQIDYHFVLLSRRGKEPLMDESGTRYPFCMPPPLAGNDDCGDGERFFHADVDIHGPQLLEQVLGTLGQTSGYQPGDALGGEPWAQHLRKGAVRELMFVTNGNSRLSAADFLHFEGGPNPHDPSLTLPPGILHQSWSDSVGDFETRFFYNVYGWLSEDHPTLECEATLGSSYESLVEITGGNGRYVGICNDPRVVLKDVLTTLTLEVIYRDWNDCSFPLLDADPNLVNVIPDYPSEVLYYAPDPAFCSKFAGWYFDDADDPTAITLCPNVCRAMNYELMRSISLRLGCSPYMWDG